MGLLNLFGGDSEQSSSSSSTDYSKSSTLAGGDSGANSASLLLGDASGATINLSDPGALSLGREIALSSLQTAQASVSSLSSATQKALTESLGLADKARQTDTQAVFGNLAKAAPWLALVGLFGYFVWKGKL